MLKILYQDDYPAAVNKLSGLLLHRTGFDAGEPRFALRLVE
jgi:23S rRNA-/tRNA-specific pseudouridylate synthase